ncbi:MAG: LysE family translocator [Anaerolineae bacterium]|nr:LysE family translocator [Anaerolineae bacterium]
MHVVALFAWSFGIAIGPVVSPGPVSVTVVTEGVRRGWRVGPLVSTGHALMELLMVGALMLGMGKALEYPALVAGVGIFGGLFLLWMGGVMGWNGLLHKPELPQPGGSPAALGARSLIGLGVATTMSNPFWYIWWIGVGSGYVLAQGQQGPAALAAFYLGHISADYAWNTLLAATAASGRRWLNARVYQALLVAGGLFLLYTGARFVWAGIGALR